MKAYIYRSALLCEPCAVRVVMASNGPHGPPNEDSDVWPQGPYENGGGEADTPQHCDKCRAFLENPLTREGAAYVLAQLDGHYATGQGNAAVLDEWQAFYSDEIREADDRRQLAEGPAGHGPYQET